MAKRPRPEAGTQVRDASEPRMPAWWRGAVHRSTGREAHAGTSLAGFGDPGSSSSSGTNLLLLNAGGV